MEVLTEMRSVGLVPRIHLSPTNENNGNISSSSSNDNRSISGFCCSDDPDDDSSRGGFDAEFSPVPEAKYKCPICIMVLRDPIQTKCGHRFCRSCLFHWLRQSSLCPACKTTIQRNETFPDNYAKREILGFTVLCPNRKNGCDATLELRDVEKHQLDICLYVYCKCPKGCSQKILRKDLKSHLETTCPVNRSYTCEFCGALMSIADRQSHSSSCPERQQVCKFCSEAVAKSEMPTHLKESCSATVIQCKFQPFGCSEQCERRDMAMHKLRSLPDHLEMLAGYILKSDRVTDSKITSMIQMLALTEKDINLLSPNKYGNIPLLKQHAKNSSQSLESPDDIGTHWSKEHLLSIAKGNSSSRPIFNKQEEESLCKSLERTVKEQAKKLTDCTEHIKRLEHMIYDLGTRSSHGTYIWKIPDFKRQFQEAKSNKNAILYSPGFYSSHYGYKTCIRVHLNGTGSAWGKHLSLFIHFMSGEFDDILQWPFNGRIILSIIDQNEHFKLRSDIKESMESCPKMEAFERPREVRNHKGFGYLEFIPLSTLLSSSFIHGDTLYIKATVDDTNYGETCNSYQLNSVQTN